MHPKDSHPSKEEVFRFLDLPLELRIQIYNLALPKKVRVRPVGPLAWSVHGYSDALALLRTSRQIRNEARPLLFSNSAFRIHLYDSVDADHVRAWIDGAGDGLVSRMERFEIGTAFERDFVKFSVRAGESGAVVTCSAARAHFRERRCLLEGSIGFPACGQRGAVWSGVRAGGWKGRFSTTDMKTIVRAVGECGALLHNGSCGWLTGENWVYGLDDVSNHSPSH